MTLPRLGSTKLRAAAVVVVAAAGLGVLSLSGMEQSLVYYMSPTEVVEKTPSTDQRVRLGGLVVPGSVRRSGDQVRLVITDGVHDVRVIHTGPLPEIFDEGQGAVVEGHVDARSRLVSDRLMVKHSNEYRPPDEVEGAVPTGAGGGR